MGGKTYKCSTLASIKTSTVMMIQLNVLTKQMKQMVFMVNGNSYFLDSKNGHFSPHRHSQICLCCVNWLCLSGLRFWKPLFYAKEMTGNEGERCNTGNTDVILSQKSQGYLKFPKRPALLIIQVFAYMCWPGLVLLSMSA